MLKPVTVEVVGVISGSLRSDEIAILYWVDLDLEQYMSGSEGLLVRLAFFKKQANKQKPYHPP